MQEAAAVPEEQVQSQPEPQAAQSGDRPDLANPADDQQFDTLKQQGLPTAEWQQPADDLQPEAATPDTTAVAEPQGEQKPPYTRQDMLNDLAEYDPKYSEYAKTEEDIKALETITEEELQAKLSKVKEEMLDSMGWDIGWPAEAKKQLLEQIPIEQLAKIQKIDEVLNGLGLNKAGSEEEQDKLIEEAELDAGKSPEPADIEQRKKLWMAVKVKSKALGEQSLSWLAHFIQKGIATSSASTFMGNFLVDRDVGSYGGFSGEYPWGKEEKSDNNINWEDFKKELKTPKKFADRFLRAYKKDGGMNRWLPLSESQVRGLEQATETENQALLREILVIVSDYLFNQNDEPQRKEAWANMSEQLAKELWPEKEGKKLSGEIWKEMLMEYTNKGKQDAFKDLLPQSAKETD